MSALELLRSAKATLMRFTCYSLHNEFWGFCSSRSDKEDRSIGDNNENKYKEQIMIRVAMLSFWHVHGKDYAKLAEEHPDTEIVAVWDENPERGGAEAAERNVPFFGKARGFVSSTQH
jgi:hypothetical protein